jgi:rubrerythrin
MEHNFDYDRDHDHDSSLSSTSLREVLQLSIDREEEMMRTYLITAERIHDDPELRVRLREFAEGNAKRSRQLIDELRAMQIIED